MSLVLGLAQVVLAAIAGFLGQLPTTGTKMLGSTVTVSGKTLPVVPKYYKNVGQFKSDWNAVCVAHGVTGIEIQVMPTLRKLRKKPPRFDPRTLKIERYFTTALPAPPPRVDWSRGFNINYGMMLNDTLGDCTEAKKGHAVQVWTLCNGRMVTVPDSVVLGGL